MISSNSMHIATKLAEPPRQNRRDAVRPSLVREW